MTLSEIKDLIMQITGASTVTISLTFDRNAKKQDETTHHVVNKAEQQNRLNALTKKLRPTKLDSIDCTDALAGIDFTDSTAIAPKLENNDRLQEHRALEKRDEVLQKLRKACKEEGCRRNEDFCRYFHCTLTEFLNMLDPEDRRYNRIMLREIIADDETPTVVEPTNDKTNDNDQSDNYIDDDDRTSLKSLKYIYDKYFRDKYSSELSFYVAFSNIRKENEISINKLGNRLMCNVTDVLKAFELRKSRCAAITHTDSSIYDKVDDDIIVSSKTGERFYSIKYIVKKWKNLSRFGISQWIKSTNLIDRVTIINLRNTYYYDYDQLTKMRMQYEDEYQHAVDTGKTFMGGCIAMIDRKSAIG